MFNYVGLKLGNYCLVRLVGQGGFADVYLGEHVYLKTEAAIKVLHTRLPGKLLQNFLAEARNHARLNHPNIVHVLDFGIENTIPFLVMHYAPHGTLRQRHPTGSILEPSIIVPYVKQITTALHYAHTRKIIHRDIKPENMLLSYEDAIMLSDFGIALALRTLHHNAGAPILFSLGTLTAGTTTYMAPEQFSGTPCYASDQYALATLVYEWFCGTSPFTGSDLQVAVKHMYKEPPLMRETLPNLEPAIERVVMKALAKNPQQRFASVQHFSDALEAVCRPISSRLYPLAKELAPATISVSSVNPLPGYQYVSTATIADQKTASYPVSHLPPFSKTISESLKLEKRPLMSFHPSSPLPVQFQPLILKKPPSLIPISIKQTKNSLHTKGQNKKWLLLAVIIFCLSSVLTLALILFTQTGLQPTKKQNPIIVTTMPKKPLTKGLPISYATKTASPIHTPSPAQTTLPVAKLTQIANPQPTSRPTPPPPVTPTPETPPAQLLLVTPSALNSTNCMPDNRTYRCTVTLTLSSIYNDQLTWHAYSMHIRAHFNSRDGTLAPGQSQQIIIYVSHKCREDSSFVFEGGGTSISIPWGC